MDLLTSRYQNHALENVAAAKVGITRGNPRMRLPYRYSMLKLLAPSRETFALAKIDDQAGFRALYLRGLEQQGAAVIRRQLQLLADRAGQQGLVLLCFDNVEAGEWCHRTFFAQWWQRETGQEVPELTGAGELVSPDRLGGLSMAAKRRMPGYAWRVLGTSSR